MVLVEVETALFTGVLFDKMDFVHVLLQRVFVCKGSITEVTIHQLTWRPLTLMINQDVPFQMSISGERLVTFITLKRPITSVR